MMIPKIEDRPTALGAYNAASPFYGMAVSLIGGDEPEGEEVDL